MYMHWKSSILNSTSRCSKKMPPPRIYYFSTVNYWKSSFWNSTFSKFPHLPHLSQLFEHGKNLFKWNSSLSNLSSNKFYNHPHLRLYTLMVHSTLTSHSSLPHQSSPFHTLNSHFPLKLSLLTTLSHAKALLFTILQIKKLFFFYKSHWSFYKLKLFFFFNL